MNQQKPIAFILPHLKWGGGQRVAINLVKGFAQRGVPLDLVLAAAEGEYLNDIPSGVRVIDLQTTIEPRLTSVLKVTLPLVRYLQTEQPEILVSNLFTCNVVAMIAQILARVSSKVALVEHVSLAEKKTRKNTIKENFLPLLMRSLYPHADVVIAVSKGLAKELETYLKMKSGSIQSIYNPVFDQSLFLKAQVPVEHPWFQDGEPPVVLGVGRLVVQKDFSTLIRAFAQVRQAQPARLVILGDGGEKRQLLDLAQEMGVESDVAILGFVDNPYAYMTKAAVFVLSSLLEGLPTVLIEAMAAGTPVVSTNCESGPAEILDNGKYGELVPVGDSQAIAEAISRILSGNSQPVEPAWLNQFTLETVTQQYLDVLGYSSVILH